VEKIAFLNQYKTPFMAELVLKTDKQQAAASYKNASPEVQQWLDEMFGRSSFILDKRERVGSFTDICREQGKNEADFVIPENGTSAEKEAACTRRCDLIELYFNPPGWLPDMADTTQNKYSCWFYIKKDDSYPSGFRLAFYACGYGSSNANLGARHQFENSDDAVYCGKTFTEEYTMLANYMNLAKMDAIKALTNK
jgi:hypothetical protein